MSALTPADHARVAAAIARAEARTSGEIYCIVSSRAAAYPETLVAVAALAAFTLPVVAIFAGLRPWALFDAWNDGPPSSLLVVETFVALQLVVFAVVALLIRLTRSERWLTPAAIRTRRLHKLATEQFLARGLHDTAERTGVLIFASLPEHHAEVIADAGIYAKVGAEHWADTVAALVAGAKAGDIIGGFEGAIALAGEVLAEHFPPGALNRNEIDDHLIEI